MAVPPPFRQGRLYLCHNQQRKQIQQPAQNEEYRMQYKAQRRAQYSAYGLDSVTQKCAEITILQPQSANKPNTITSIKRDNFAVIRGRKTDTVLCVRVGLDNEVLHKISLFTTTISEEIKNKKKLSASSCSLSLHLISESVPPGA